jgi:hypothetical protein
VRYVDNGVQSFTLIRPASDGLTLLRFLSGPLGHLRRVDQTIGARRSILVGSANQIELHPGHVVPAVVLPCHAPV